MRNTHSFFVFLGFFSAISVKCCNNLIAWLVFFFASICWLIFVIFPHSIFTKYLFFLISRGLIYKCVRSLRWFGRKEWAAPFATVALATSVVLRVCIGASDRIIVQFVDSFICVSVLCACGWFLCNVSCAGCDLNMQSLCSANCNRMDCFRFCYGNYSSFVTEITGLWQRYATHVPKSYETTIIKFCSILRYFPRFSWKI